MREMSLVGTHFIDQIGTHNGPGNRRDDNKLALTRCGTGPRVSCRKTNQQFYFIWGGGGWYFFPGA